jgi:uncharacterized membrane protein
MPRFVLLALSALALVLVACAPGVKGSSSVYAIDLDNENPVITAGSRWYFSSDYSPKYLGIELPQDWSLQGASVGRTYRSDQGNNVKVTQQGLPESWEFRFHSATGIQTITNTEETGSRIYVQWRERVQFVFTAFVPASTEPGTYRGMVTITSGYKTDTFSVTIRVDGVSGAQS